VIAYRKAFSNADQGVQGAGMLSGRDAVSVSPSPVQGCAVVTLNRFVTYAQYTISDVNGRVILSGTFLQGDTFVLNTAVLLPGCYVLQVSDSEGVIRVKIIKE